MKFKIKDRVIECINEQLIGDNADYVAEFTFDDEWNGKTKTARFEMLDKHKDVILTNGSCTIPVDVLKEGFLKVGIYSTSMVTTACSVYITPSIKEVNGITVAPATDVYTQIIAKLDELIESGVSPEQLQTAIETYFTTHPLPSGITESQCRTIVQGYISQLTIPTKTSQLTNDSNFITNAYHDSTKQDVINDLTTIRSGAEKGATALQSVPSDYAKKTDIPSLNGYATETWVENKGYLTTHQDISGKQDKLVSGTNIATINGNNLLNGGNIVIQGGSGGTTDYSALTNKPSINNVELSGNKTLSDLGINNLSTSDVDTEVQTYWNAHKTELKGDKGEQGIQGEKGADGQNGTNGVSATHSWNGTTLTITSASGTSSADLKGAKGQNGNDGYTPIKGTDYFTDSDKAELVQAVIDALPIAESGVF